MKVVSEIGLFQITIIANFFLPSLESATIEFENLDSLVHTGTVTEVGTPA